MSNITYLRPLIDVGPNEWSTVGAGDSHARRVDDDPDAHDSDTTALTTDTNNKRERFRFSEPTPPEFGDSVYVNAWIAWKNTFGGQDTHRLEATLIVNGVPKTTFSQTLTLQNTYRKQVFDSSDWQFSRGDLVELELASDLNLVGKPHTLVMSVTGVEIEVGYTVAAGFFLTEAYPSTSWSEPSSPADSWTKQGSPASSWTKVS